MRICDRCKRPQTPNADPNLPPIVDVNEKVVKYMDPKGETTIIWRGDLCNECQAERNELKAPVVTWVDTLPPWAPR